MTEQVNAASDKSLQEQTKQEVRVVAGLQEGRLVNYVMRDHSIRPLLVVNARDRAGLVDGVLFFNGPSDNGLHVIPMEAEHSGFIPYTVRNLKAVPFDESKTLMPGTWHWPQRQPVVAAGLDNAALEQIVDALTQSVMRQAKIAMDAQTELVNDKLAQTVETVNQSLNSHSEMIKQVLVSPSLPTTPVPSPEELQAREPIGTAAEPSGADMAAHAADQAAQDATAEPQSQDAAQAGS